MGSPGRSEEAVQLRLAGLSRSQIADALGLRSGGQSLTRWLQGVPPPAWTRRPRAKDEARETGPKEHRRRLPRLLAIYVRRSAELNLRIAGWCEGIATIASGIVVERSGVV